MSIMTTHISKSVDFTKTRKSRYLKNETISSSNKKIHYLDIKDFFMTKNSFVAEVKQHNLFINHFFKEGEIYLSIVIWYRL